jgi:stalled ribosome rescue protein Dom34
MATVTHTGAAADAARSHRAVVVLMDHRTARVLYLETDWTLPRFRVHDRSESEGSGRLRPDPRAYFQAVADAVGRADRAVVVGPGSAKLEWLRWAAARRHPAADRVEALQSMDRATDGELGAMARRLLHAEPGRFFWPRNAP